MEEYSREYFNAYGDNVFPRAEQQMEFAEGQINVPQINDSCMDRLNELNEYITAKRMEMAVVAYPIVKCEYTSPAEEYKKMQEELESRLDCTVISDFTDYFIDETYFWDSAFHLNERGVKIRTEQLIKDVENWKSLEAVCWYNFD